MEENKIVVREDLNEIVKNIAFKKIKNSYGERFVCNVTFINDKVIEFRDNEHVYELFQSYLDVGETDFIKSKELVDEEKKDDEGQIVGVYCCVRYTLKDGTIIRLFTSKFNDNKIIDNYYRAYKNKKATAPKK